VSQHSQPLTRRNRFVIQGPSGSGKTTLAGALAAQLGCAHLELDAIFHQRDWTPIELDDFRSKVEEFTAGPQWVIDGNYSHVRDIVWARADVIAFIDLPRSTVMSRVVKRTLRRVIRQEEMWNGNRESLRNVVSFNRSKNIILWSWTTHSKYHEHVPEEARQQAHHAQVVMLRSTQEVEAFLRSSGRVS
jgi:adenylate kinase family enzyme